VQKIGESRWAAGSKGEAARGRRPTPKGKKAEAEREDQKLACDAHGEGGLENARERVVNGGQRKGRAGKKPRGVVWPFGLRSTEKERKNKPIKWRNPGSEGKKTVDCGKGVEMEKKNPVFSKDQEIEFLRAEKEKKGEKIAHRERRSGGCAKFEGQREHLKKEKRGRKKGE